MPVNDELACHFNRKHKMKFLRSMVISPGPNLITYIFRCRRCDELFFVKSFWFWG